MIVFEVEVDVFEASFVMVDGLVAIVTSPVIQREANTFEWVD